MGRVSTFARTRVRAALDYRERQRASLRARPARPRLPAPEVDEQLERALHADAEGGVPAPGPAGTARGYGPLGRPLNKHSPFYIGFFGGVGALLAITLWNSIGRLTTTLTILVVAFFLTLALNPLVEWFTRRGWPRSGGVAVVFGGLLLFFVLLGLVVVPPVVSQGTDLAQSAPTYLQRVLDSDWVQRLDRDYDALHRAQAEFEQTITDGSFAQRVLGGVLGASKAVATGTFQSLTVLVLTLYFLASFPQVKQAAFELVPASRRPRFVLLSEEIMRRTGSYAIGQAAVAMINALASYVVLTIIGVPFPAVLAVVVGFLGLIPLVGATLGAVIVGLVAFFNEPKDAITVGIYYLVYQQIENYVIAPRIMQRTVSVPGALTVVAALAGGTLLGVLGALLAIPVAAGLLLIYDEVVVPRQRSS
ncbi:MULTISPECIES: AI-2E family transporter [unclassified Janibacter]|uniref:AI-2E family transporter n=1 Tax=unclassified Janibacter TaxID=2649294 RepID=UPI003D00DA7F